MMFGDKFVKVNNRCFTKILSNQNFNLQKKFNFELTVSYYTYHVTEIISP